MGAFTPENDHAITTKENKQPHNVSKYLSVLFWISKLKWFFLSVRSTLYYWRNALKVLNTKIESCLRVTCRSTEREKKRGKKSAQFQLELISLKTNRNEKQQHFIPCLFLRLSLFFPLLYRMARPSRAALLKSFWVNFFYGWHSVQHTTFVIVSHMHLSYLFNFFSLVYSWSLQPVPNSEWQLNVSARTVKIILFFTSLSDQTRTVEFWLFSFVLL